MPDSSVSGFLRNVKEHLVLTNWDLAHWRSNSEGWEGHHWERWVAGWAGNDELSGEGVDLVEVKRDVESSRRSATSS